MRDVTSITGVSELVLLAKVKYGNEFNLSKFVRDALEHALFEGEVFTDPRKEAAKRAAESILRERANQKKLIEEARSYEQIAREMKERDEKTFCELASQVLEDPDRYLKFLPEFSSGDMSEYWQQKAKTLTQLCGFPVTVDSVQSYIRRACNVA